MDTEYAERNGILFIPRIIERPGLNEDLKHINEREIHFEQHFREIDRPIRVSRSSGINSQPHLAADTVISNMPPTGYVSIEVMAFGLGDWDTQENAEEFRARSTLGLECSGRVLAVGAGVQSLSVGDRVACLGVGTARSYYQDRESAFQRIEDFMDFQTAAAVPVSYTTAYFIMHYLTRVRPDEFILIQDAASLLGQAIIEICCIREARVLATVNDLTQKDLLLSRCAIPPERIFIEDTNHVIRNVLELTGGKRVRILISMSKKDHQKYQTLLECVAPFGHMVCITSGRPGGNLSYTSGICENEIFSKAKNISLSLFNIFDFQKDRADLARQIWSKVIQHFKDGRFHGPSSLFISSISDLSLSNAILDEPHVVVNTENNELIQMTRPKLSKEILRSDASYLLVGGLGGIGRAIALWMADNGAKNLILLNRSGIAKESAHSTLQELTVKGVQVDIHACDISNEAEVRQMFLDISWVAPPIRGIVLGAMILKDIHIERMTVDDYLEVLRPRYNGTWNLHRHGPTDLDFFLMLSSISGIIGNATQAAYAAGSAFMDSFALYRNTLGLPATSLDLGTVTDVGYLAANKELATKMAKQGFQGMDTKTILSLVQIAIEQPLSVRSNKSQIITGLGVWIEGQSLGNFDAPLFAHFRRRFRSEGVADGEADNTAQVVRDALRASKSQNEAIPIIFEFLSARIASQLGISVERIDPASPLSEFGVDSHVAVELRDWINKMMESTVSILEILASDSVLQLAGHIASRSMLIETRGDI